MIFQAFVPVCGILPSLIDFIHPNKFIETSPHFLIVFEQKISPERIVFIPQKEELLCNFVLVFQKVSNNDTSISRLDCPMGVI